MIEKILRIEGEEGIREWDIYMASPMPWTWTWENCKSGEGQRGLACCIPWATKSWTWLGDWTTTYIYIHTHTTYSLLVHRYLAYFHILAIVNNAVIHIGVHVFFLINWWFCFSGYIHRNGIARSYGNSIFSFFEERCILFSPVAAPVYIPTSSVPGFPFLTSSPELAICRHFDDNHSDRCEAISCIDLHFSNN